GDESRAAAGRELCEGVGTLGPRRSDRRFARNPECRRLRERLIAGADWIDALRGLELTPATDRLVFLARWITPEAVARRFDTRFYLARRPSGQTVHPQPGEVVSWAWTTPAGALAVDGPPPAPASRGGSGQRRRRREGRVPAHDPAEEAAGDASSHATGAAPAGWQL